MARIKQLRSGLRDGAIGAALAIGVGLMLWWTPAGSGLERMSYDRSFAWLPYFAEDSVSVVLMDDAAYHATGQKWSTDGWDRGIHARFVEQLTREGARVVVFDSWFAEPGDGAKDAALARALRVHGRVALAGQVLDLKKAGGNEVEAAAGERILPPNEKFRTAVGTNWGVPGVLRDPDGVIRRHFPERDLVPSLPWVAATLANAAVTTNGTPRAAPRWVRYYGGYGELGGMSYHAATNLPGFFANKIVFIGGKPGTRFTGEEVDEFATPFTRQGAGYMAGVEIEATMFLNLVRGDWLERPAPWAEALVLLLCGGALGCGLCGLRPMRGTAVALGGLVLVALLGVGLVRWTDYWFPWLLVGAGQIPCAWAWSVLAYTTRLAREKTVLENAAARRAAAIPAPAPALAPTSTEAPTRPLIPDHTLYRAIGRGAYGQVWLARNAVGILHAVKLVHRREFNAAEPYEREFNGIRMFMPVSLEHPGLVRVLHVGRDDAAGYFYYVMELGDDVAGGRQFEVANYAAKTLDGERRRRGRFPLAECVQIGLRLTDALHYLHSQRLVHRDIKPGNIIFVNGIPKFADIGLVTDLREADESRTYIGSFGYIPPEGPGTAVADIFGLGRVLYVLGTGLSPDEFPALPPDLGERTDVPGFFLFNDIVLKAADADHRRRYATAREMHAALLSLSERLARSSAEDPGLR